MSLTLTQERPLTDWPCVLASMGSSGTTPWLSTCLWTILLRRLSVSSCWCRTLGYAEVQSWKCLNKATTGQYLQFNNNKTRKNRMQPNFCKLMTILFHPSESFELFGQLSMVLNCGVVGSGGVLMPFWTYFPLLAIKLKLFATERVSVKTLYGQLHLVGCLYIPLSPFTSFVLWYVPLSRMPLWLEDLMWLVNCKAGEDSETICEANGN